MELSDKIKYCAICRNSKRDMERGIVCGLTNEKPTFDKHCADLQATANDIAELEESMIGGSQKSATKILTAVVIVVFAIAMGVMWLIHNQEDKAKPSKTTELRNDALEAIINAKMATLPQPFAEGITTDSILLKKKYVKIALTIADTYLRDYTDDRLICESKFRHSQMLKHLRSEDRELLNACLNDSLQIRYAFYEPKSKSAMNAIIVDPVFPTSESRNQRIYAIVIHPADISNALSATEPFRCPNKDFERVLKSDKKGLPFDIVSKIQLSAIKMDYGANKLTLNLRSRRKVDNSAYEQLAKTEIWKSAVDLLAVKMLMLNEGEIDFRFIGPDDRLVESVVVGPDFYQK